ncbi:PHA/PHB synthase family protein [Sedimentitalea nanhaiensis]|uniref:Polyhydroxyalkanoate synthase n=1 Tax=Sedimentitalea nanhaiensis TaxID=999627 RepID=A0A1I7BT61_9RHOB|nr:class I poly(R)-hydroxyalkanoic acid synthase [Sedimentitalea nanhaiensis]SFT90366.1 polyhydroxyalkanoate synthase [Sedimentitalea nanhaiensis]
MSNPDLQSDPLNERLLEYWSLMQRAQGLFSRAATSTAAKVSGGDFSIVDSTSVAAAYAKVGMAMATRPADLMALQQSAFGKMANIWMAGWTGTASKIKDRRFRDDSWNTDPIARVCRDVHLALEEATLEILNQFPEDSKEHLRVKFYTRQILSALAPSNFLTLNPQARKKLLDTDGQSLLDGFSNLLDDLERGDGRLDIATNDPKAFVVGRDLGTTPGKVVFQNDMMQLIQFEPRTKTQRKRPILFVPAWINKYYIMDMREKNSLVRYMLDRGHTVFIISWVNPGPEHAEKSFEHYMNEGPLAAIDAIELATGEKKINILGFCIGGILVTATLAYLAAKGDNRVAAATTLATMVDFTDVGEIGVFIDDERLETLRDHMAETGHLEGYHMQDMFSMIRENDLVWSFHVMNYLMGNKPPAFDLLYWNSDSTRLPAAMLLWYLEQIYLRNALRQPGGLVLNGTKIDLGKIKTPCFVLATKEDHIAPWRSVYPTTGLLGGDVKFVLGGSGHIAGVINPPGEREKYGYWIGRDYPESPEEWLEKATHAKGSWWPTWADWLEAKDRAKQVPARVPGDGRLDIIEDAPGTYVLSK